MNESYMTVQKRVRGYLKLLLSDDTAIIESDCVHVKLPWRSHVRSRGCVCAYVCRMRYKSEVKKPAVDLIRQAGVLVI